MANISSPEDHRILQFSSPLWVTEGFLYGIRLLPLFHPVPFSVEDVWGSDTSKSVTNAPGNFKETPKHL